ncbi:helix-turn-helix domain-containing protein [Streptomyces lydicus]|uniref:helix-turn-helix domain-containing protein n=1 Tax=Streptomyces lydicus TaxID=47763 RepID=UPI001013BBB6|nr:helix-turn-helix transcriptional regulator [Streptomyces lydicus]MCZ1012236.1 helix-turn-helix transcriptional regulator [Streptomyces lydicus]
MVITADDRSVALCRILLGLKLRRLREGKGLKASAVAKRFGWSTARMTRLETKMTAVEVGDVRLLCDLYEVSRELRDELESYALISKTGKGWWDAKSLKQTVPEWFRANIGLEAAARRIWIYQSEFVPGLAQVLGYAMAILGLSDADEETIDRHAEVRATRQSILTRPDGAPDVMMTLNEAVIRRPVGGADVMRQQLERLSELAQQPNISVKILPFSAGAHPAMHGPFTIWGFDDEIVGDLAYLENLVDGGVLSDVELVAPFIAAFEQLERLAATEEQSLAMIQSTAAAL